MPESTELVRNLMPLGSYEEFTQFFFYVTFGSDFQLRLSDLKYFRFSQLR